MDSKAEQYYPTYSFKTDNRDVVLLEFEEAQKLANTQTKIYGQVANVLLAIIAVVIPLFFNLDKEQVKDNLTIFHQNAVIFAIILFIFGAILLRYFVELQRQITFNARKVITLRLMLGLDYGNIHLTLPNFRVEGATNPFVIKFFNGWLWFQSVPFWILTIGINFVWFLSAKNNLLFEIPFTNHNIWYFGHFIIITTYFIVFRQPLYEDHENIFLSMTKNISRLFRIKLLKNFGYILYRAKLAYIELDRLNVNYDDLIKILIEIEDQGFKQNSGISLKPLFRGFLSRFKYFRNRYRLIPNGGSTLTMQLVRTLFIPSNQPKYRRKLVEILLSLWIDKQFDKSTILKLYISSVRFEKGIMGLSSAIKYFFNANLNSKTLTIEESFFLVERLSNISSSINWNRIENLKSRVSITIDSEKLKELYDLMVQNNKLTIF